MTYLKLHVIIWTTFPFILIVEVLIKEPADFQYKDYRNLEKIDILALLTVGDFDTDREQLKNSNVTYSQAINFVRV
jgi:hypothetical protein